MTEGFHKKYEYYRAFKKQIITEEGAQRVLDYRVFGHNFRQFPEYIHQYKIKYKSCRRLVRNSRGDKILQGQGSHFRSMFKKLDTYFGNYKEI